MRFAPKSQKQLKSQSLKYSQIGVKVGQMCGIRYEIGEALFGKRSVLAWHIKHGRHNFTANQIISDSKLCI